MKSFALVACVVTGVGCGLRTDMLSPDAQVASPDTPPDRPAGREAARERPDAVPPSDLQPADLLRMPDLPPDRAPDRRPDLPPDRAPDWRPDLPPDRPPDRLPDLPALPDLPRDLRRDLPPDLAWDVRPDLLPDSPGDRFRDLLPELPPPDDAQCAPGSTQPCTCDNGLQGSRICLPNLVYSECGCGTEALMRVKNGLIGTWTGTATTPWLAPYHVTFIFDSYNHYASRALDGNGSPALYYGTDNDMAVKKYDVTDIQANGDASGTIDVCFDDGYCTRDNLRGIALSTDLSQLKFYFNYRGEYGPLQYDLARATP